MVDRETERDLPAQIPRDGLHRLLVGESGAVLEQQHLRQLRRRDRGTADSLRVAVGEVLIADDPLTVLGEQSEEGALGERPDQLRGIEESNLSCGR